MSPVRWDSRFKDEEEFRQMENGGRTCPRPGSGVCRTRPPLGHLEDSSTRLRITQVPGEKRPVGGS